MFWQEETADETYQVPEDIVDVAYRIACKCLPLDHAHALSRALHEALPWLEEEPRAGIHLIHGAESGNGWMRPEDPDNELLYLSRRTRLTLRLPKERIEEASGLVGQVLDIEGYTLEVGEPAVRQLSPAATIFARYVADMQDEGEEAFLQAVSEELQALGVKVRKLMCGRQHLLRTPGEAILTRSVMVADLEKDESVIMQQHGVGPHRKLGCGLFIPHKGIAPVASAAKE